MANIIPTYHAHMRIYIKVPYFTYFRFPASSIVGLVLGLVVGLVLCSRVSSLSKFSIMVSFSLKISFRVRVNFNMRHQGHRFDYL